MWKTTLFLKRNNTLFLLVGVFLLLVACEPKPQKSSKIQANARAAATAGLDTLYESEVQKVIKDASGQDSIMLRERFITNWVRKSLLLKIAKNNLSEEERDIEDMIKEYRASLLVSQYKQKYLAEHLDTLVTENEIKEYVSKFANNFRAKKPLYRYYLGKILTKNKKDVWFIYQLFTKDENEINLMQEFKLENTTVISICDEEWYSAKELAASLPISEGQLKALKRGKVFMSKDSTTTYVLKPLRIIQKGNMNPKEIINEQVKKIILHNRKIALAKKLEDEIYEDAKNKNQITVY